MIESAVPSLLFVGVHAVAGLGPSVAAAILAAVCMLVMRRLRGQSLRPAVGGLVGVAVSSAFAYRTGDARDFFLPDIWGYAVCAVVAGLSITVRWPIAGVLWSALNGTSMRWRKDRRVLIGYSIATAVATLVFATRSVAQMWFYQHDQPGMMVLMRIVLNYPLWVIAALAWAWSIRRAGRPA